MDKSVGRPFFVSNLAYFEALTIVIFAISTITTQCVIGSDYEGV